jgi:hypothetical protein
MGDKMQVTVTVTVCDVCGEEGVGRPVTEYEVRSDGRSGKTVRCEEHSAEFAAVLDAAPLVRPAKRTGRPKASRREATMTMEEIEALKRRR